MDTRKVQRTDTRFMLIEDVRMCESLRRIVNGFTGDLALQQDMLQECLVCLWKIESEKPGRTRSWYLQNCRFHVQHWLAAGRSLDSHKRAVGGNRVAIHGTDEDTVLDCHHTNGELFETVSVRDLVATLTPLLKPAERLVLRGLAEGLVLRDIAAKSGISYPTALKYRRHIAALASRLGVYSAHAAKNGDSIPLMISSGSGLNAPFGRTNATVGHKVVPHRKAKTARLGAGQKTQPLTSLKQVKLGLKTNPGKARNRQELNTPSHLGSRAAGTARRLAA